MIRRRLLFVLPVLMLMPALAAPRASTQAAPPVSQIFDAAALLKDLQILSADDMQGREIGTAGGEKARSYIVERFRAVGLLPVGNGYSWPFTFAGGRAGNQPRSGVNVVGRLPGTRPDGRYIVITAHYDHIGIRNGVVFNGADDNGSGTAALFTVATYFKAHPTEHPLLFVAFDGEESGLRGAEAFVREPPVPAASLALNLNMDMIGREPGDKLFVVGTRTQPALLPAIQRVAATAPVKLLAGHDDPGQKEDWTRDSDHYAFMQAKIPALYFGVEDFDQHHKATDDFATITAGFYVRAVETMIAVVREFDASLDTLR